jgi:hypothetical protein
MDSSNQRVSVIMPVHNGEDYLRISVASILSQTYPHFEFIIVDDGSTDGTGAILAELAGTDDRIRVIQGRRGGIPAALNQAISLSSGEIIFRIDHDDIAWPRRIESQLRFLVENPSVAVVGSSIEIIDRNGWPRKTVKYSTSPSEMAAMLKRGTNPLASPTTVMRRSAVLSVGGFHPAFQLAQDFDLWCRLSERYDLANLPEILLSYRWHGDNITQKRRYEQGLAAQIARLAARERRHGRPDPTLGLTALSLNDLDRMDMSPAERSKIMVDLGAAGLAAFKATGHPHYLAEVEHCVSHKAVGGKKSNQIANELAEYLWINGRRYRSVRIRARMFLSQFERAPRSFEQLAPKLQRIVNQRTASRSLVHFADPQGAKVGASQLAFHPSSAKELVKQADAHGVLPIVLRNFPWPENDAAFDSAKLDATLRYRAALSLTLMLRHYLEDLAPRIAHLPAAVVRGPAFAHALYARPEDRPLTGVDILAAPAALAKLADILAEQGFKPTAVGSTPVTRRWVHCDNGSLMLNVKTNLVDAPSLARFVSLSFDDVAGRVDTPAAQLLVALISGSVHMHFEQLFQLVDVCQASRNLSGIDDEEEFVRLVSRTGSRFAARSGLELAAKIMDEPRCLAIAQALGPVRHGAFAGLLLNRSVVTSAATPWRWMYSWRRKGFRLLMKRQSFFQQLEC